MRTFNEFMVSKTTTAITEDLAAAMINCGISDFEKFLGEWLFYEHGIEAFDLYVEVGGAAGPAPAFKDKKGWWGNLWQGLKGAGQAGAGGAAAGVGGAGGGVLGTLGGMARTGMGAAQNVMTGKAPTGASDNTAGLGGLQSTAHGVQAGSQTGRGMMGAGMDAIKGAWAGRHDAGIVTQFGKATKAVNKLQNLVGRHPQLSSDAQLQNTLSNLAGTLAQRGRSLEKKMQGANMVGGQPQPPVVGGGGGMAAVGA